MFNLLIKLELTNQVETRINASNEAVRKVQPNEGLRHLLMP